MGTTSVMGNTAVAPGLTTWTRFLLSFNSGTLCVRTLMWMYRSRLLVAARYLVFLLMALILPKSRFRGPMASLQMSCVGSSARHCRAWSDVVGFSMGAPGCRCSSSKNGGRLRGRTCEASPLYLGSSHSGSSGEGSPIRGLRRPLACCRPMFTGSSGPYFLAPEPVVCFAVALSVRFRRSCFRKPV